MGQLVLQQDLAPADWLVDRMQGGHSLAAFVPSGFEAYVRVLHPSYRRHSSPPVPVRWADVAIASGATFHPQMRWDRMAGRGDRFGTPTEGSLPRDLVHVLVGVLGDYTSRPDTVWFGIWEGWGWLRFLPDSHSSATLMRRRLPLLGNLAFRYRQHRRRPPPPAPRFHLPYGRAHYLFGGPIAGATESFGRSWRSANLWWPEDHAWVVATEIDFRSTYVGGTRSCIDALRANRDLETVPISIRDKIGWGADQINPPPDEDGRRHG